MRGSKDWSSLRIRARAASRADMEDLLACRDSVVAIVDSTRPFNELKTQYPTPNQVASLTILCHSSIVSSPVNVEVKFNALSRLGGRSM